MTEEEENSYELNGRPCYFEVEIKDDGTFTVTLVFDDVEVG